MFFTKPKNEISFSITEVFATRWTFAAKLSQRETPIEIAFDEESGRVSVKKANELSQEDLNMVAQASRVAIVRLMQSHKSTESLSSVTMSL